MGILDDVLKEELERLNRIESVYLNELKRLPKGNIIFKNIKGRQYPYLQYRAGDKVKSKYIKKFQLDGLKQDLIKRKELEQAIKRVYLDKRKIEKVFINEQ